MKSLKTLDITNAELMNFKKEELEFLSKKFFLFNNNNIENSGRFIFSYYNNFCVENIVGFMEIVRYPIVGNITLNDKEPLEFDYFKENETLKYDDYDYGETLLTQLDTFILIKNVEVLKGCRNQGIGSSMYRYLENMITTSDSLLEYHRTISGKTHDLLNKIEKVPVFTDISELFYI